MGRNREEKEGENSKLTNRETDFSFQQHLGRKGEGAAVRPGEKRRRNGRKGGDDFVQKKRVAERRVTGNAISRGKIKKAFLDERSGAEKETLLHLERDDAGHVSFKKERRRRHGR